jgi:hypothetical protein
MRRLRTLLPVPLAAPWRSPKTRLRLAMSLAKRRASPPGSPLGAAKVVLRLPALKRKGWVHV